MHLTRNGHALAAGSAPPLIATDCGVWVDVTQVTKVLEDVDCPGCRVVAQARRAKHRGRSASHTARKLTDSMIQRRRQRPSGTDGDGHSSGG